MTARCIFRAVAFALAVLPPGALLADSSSPRLAAYYDRQMAIVGGEVYGWRGDNPPQKMRVQGVQVAVGNRRYYVLTPTGTVLVFKGLHILPKKMLSDVVRFAAGNDGVTDLSHVDGLFGDSEDVGRLESFDELAAGAAAVGVENDRGDVPHVGVDRVTEDDQLQNRYEEHEFRGRVTAHLNHFLIDNRLETVQHFPLRPSRSISSHTALDGVLLRQRDKHILQ